MYSLSILSSEGSRSLQLNSFSSFVMLAGWEGRTRSTKLSSESVLCRDLRHNFHFAQDSVGDLEDFHKFLFCLNHPEWMLLLATKKSLYYIESLL